MNRFAVYLLRTDESICRAVFELADRRSAAAPLFAVSVSERTPAGDWTIVVPNGTPAGAWSLTDIMAAVMAMGVTSRVAPLFGMPEMPVWVLHESAAIGAMLPVSLAGLFKRVGLAA